MAIAFDTATDGGLVNPGTSLSWSHTCTGANLALLVGVRSTTAVTDNVSGVTYNGVSCSLLAHVSGSMGLARATSLWLLLGPATGANTIVVSGTSDVIMAEAGSYTGVKQSSQPDATGTNTSFVTAVTVSLTTIADNCWVVAVFGNNGGTPTAGSGTTFRVTSANGIGFGDSNGVVHPAGSYSMTATQAGSSADTGVAASLAPAGGAAPSLFRTPSLSGLGVGGSFFRDPLQGQPRPQPSAFVRRDRIYVPQHVAAGSVLEAA